MHLHHIETSIISKVCVELLKYIHPFTVFLLLVQFVDVVINIQIALKNLPH